MARADEAEATPELSARARRVVTALTIVVFVAWILMCLHAAFGPWQWGHNGFNGAAFAQAARNTLRFHVAGQALYYTGLTPPGRDLLYTHHPQMLHWHLVLLFKLFGEQPWVGRLVPATYSILTLFLVHRIARRYWDEVTALVAIALYAFTPLHSIFANMIDHEQGGIFWCLLAVYAYVRWSEAHAGSWLATCLVSISFAAQFDWPAYYIAFFVVLHAFGVGLRRGGPVLRWRPEWTFVVLFSIVVLANFGGFFLWIKQQRGTVAEMGAAYAHRTGRPVGYARQVYTRMLDLHGPVIMWLTALWAPLWIVRARDGRARTPDLLPGAFLLAQVVHSLLFRNAGFIHSYWTYWLGPATAFGGADVAVTAFRTLRAWSVKAERRTWVRPTLVVVALVLVLFQVRYAFARLRWGYLRGSASYIVPTPDIRDDVRAAQFLAKRFAREDTLYLFHDSLPERAEVHWYHDTPFEARTTILPLLTDMSRAKHVVVVADLHGVGERSDLARMVREHPTIVFDRRLVAIDVSTMGARFEAYRSEPRTQGAIARWVHRWFVDPLAPPMDWVADDAAEVRALVGYDAPLEFVRETNTKTGAPHAWDCPPGEFIAAFEGAETDRAPTTVARLRGRCARLAKPGEGETTPSWGGASQRPEHASSCPAASAAIGIAARTGRFLDAVQVLCAVIRSDGSIDPARTATGEWIGGPGGEARTILCPLGQVVRGIRVRAGALVDGVGIACGPVAP